MTLFQCVMLAGGGLVAGFIDSIAGGGGLVTLPLLLWVLGSGADAVGTNKIVGSTAALVAFLVYVTRRPIPWRQTIQYSLLVALGSAIGSGLTPLVPRAAFPFVLVCTVPVVLWVVFKKSLWLDRTHSGQGVRSRLSFVLSGVVIGCYDGMWGPGGGTFMLLGLVLFGGMPVIDAVGASKFVNWVSASVAWARFGAAGYVHVTPGLWLTAGVIVGAWTGALSNSKRAGLLVRPMLVLVAGLLALKIAFDFLQ